MLYIVATPIGNLSELSPRAIETLKSVSLIAAEDTRHSGVLLKHFGINTKLISYQKFNERKSTAALIERLKSGEDIALISDAGMPLISDPGHILVDECYKNGIQVTAVSGACALVNAVVLSGLDTSSFVMLGFLPDKQSLKEQHISPYKNVPSTLVFYSPPQSVLKDLAFLFAQLGARRFAVIKELTKLHETVVRGCLGEAVEIHPKGEFVIVVEGYTPPKETRSVFQLVDGFLSEGMDKMQAIKAAAKALNLPKNEVYKAVLDSEGNE